MDERDDSEKRNPIGDRDGKIRSLNAKLEDFIREYIVEGRASGIERLGREFEVGEEQRCWEFNNCTNDDCPARTDDRRRCWLVDGTLCHRTMGDPEPGQSLCDCCEYRRFLSEDPLRALEENLYTIVYNLVRSKERLSRIAIKDPLTGVHNRAFFNEAIRLETAKIERLGGYILFVMIDIDDFKKINDTEGHHRGDEILAEVASVLRQNVRASDMVIRYGGDEFLIVAPRADRSSCEPIIARLLQTEAELEMSGDFPSMSMGCSEWSAGEDVDEAIRRADSRMYRHKRSKTPPPYVPEPEVVGINGKRDAS